MSINNETEISSSSMFERENVAFSPTDTTQLSKSATPNSGKNTKEGKNNDQRRSSRLPIMPPSWYSRGSGVNNSIVPEYMNERSPNNSNANDTRTREVQTMPNGREDLSHISVMYNRQKYYSRLVDPSDDRMRIPDHVIPAWMFYPIPTKTTDSQHSLVTVFAIWNTMMGTSLLSMPWGFVQSGFLLGILLIVTMGLVTLYTAYRVLRSKEYLDFEAFEFSDVCKSFLGRPGEWIAIIFSIATFLGGMLVYWVLMTNFMYVTGLFIYDKTTRINDNSTAQITNSTEYGVLCRGSAANSSFVSVEHSGYGSQDADNVFNSWWSSNRTVPVYLALLVFPMLNIKSPTFFTKFNCLGTLSVFFVLTFVITKAASWGWHLEISFSAGQLPQFRSTFPALTGMLSLAFFLHSAVITILKTNKHQENNVRDLSLGYLLVALTYLTVGVVFYGSFPLAKHCITANLLENFPTHDGFATAARIFLLLQMFSVFPLLAYMCRVNALYALFQDIWPGRLHVIVLNLLVVAMCVLVAVFYPHIGDIIRYSGSLCGLIYIFCFPCLIYMMALKERSELTIPKAVVHSIIMLTGLLNFIAQFIIKPAG